MEERNTDGLPVIMMAHTTVQGCNFTGHDNANETSVGGIDSMPHDAFGKGYDYLALGHIHHAQFIHGTNHRMRYSGTPLAVSFDETYDHSVSLVEISKHGEEPKLTVIPIDNPQPLVTLPTQGTASWDKAKKLLESFPNDNQAYIRLNVEVNDFLPPGAMDEARSIASDKQCRVCHINTKRPERTHSQAKALTVEELQKISPLNLVKRYANDKNVVFDKTMEDMFNEVLAALQQQERN